MNILFLFVPDCPGILKSCDLKSLAVRRTGSIPVPGTITKSMSYGIFALGFVGAWEFSGSFLATSPEILFRSPVLRWA